MERMQDYLKEPEAVEARSTVDGMCFVSGVSNAAERTDQFLFDLLNHEESAFEFNSITAFVQDTAFSKKRLLSRSARYTGLLDKLKFVQANDGTKLPTVEQLAGAKSWLAVLDGTHPSALDECHMVAQLAAAAPDMVNVAVLITEGNELDANACNSVVQSFKSSGKQFTVVNVGHLTDEPEGKFAYMYEEFGTPEGTLPEKSVFSRQEAYRMVTELLQLECGANKALSFAEVYNVNATETRLIKGLREAGYARPLEIDHMIREGAKAYDAAMEDFKTSNPDWEKGYTTDAWWEAPEFKESRERSDARAAAELAKVKDERTQQVEMMAKEWSKREFFRLSMEGTVGDMDEDAFLKQNWDRAMKEGEWAYRKSKGELTEEEALNEMEDFKVLQDKKQKIMLERAKEELKDLIDDDDDK